MCHAGEGAGASLPLEAPSPTRIKCEWLRRALLPLGTGNFCQSTLWIASYRGDSSVTKASIKDAAPRPWATGHDDQLLTGATVHEEGVLASFSSSLAHLHGSGG